MADLRVKYFTRLCPDFVALTRQLDAELNERNGPWQAEYDAFNALDGIRDVVLAYDADTPVGCASMKRFDGGVYEVKRVFVVPRYRRHGVARLLMARLEAEARVQGIRELILETADRLAGAVAMYGALGYHVVENYGQYRDKLHSVCFCKTLGEFE